MRLKAKLLPPLAALLLAALAAPALQTDNHGIHAVPAPGKVAVDGKLGDWDLSGKVMMCYDVLSLKDVYSGTVAMMYDAEALYVAIHWKDPIPLGNSHAPQFQADKGWAGDSVQLRFKTDRITHLTAWCYAPKSEPFINLDYGKSLSEPFGGGSRNLFRKDGWTLDGGAEMAFLKDSDGKGYVQEMKLPWTLITNDGKRPADSFRCGVELLWGEADWPVHRYADNLADGTTSREFFWTAHNSWGQVVLEPKGNLSLPSQPWDNPPGAEKAEGPVALAYTLPKDSRVTLAIDDANGKRVRNLLPAAERKQGENTDFWDCLDDDGNIVPPGTFTVKGLSQDGLHMNYVGSFASPGNPGWGTADGKGAFYGDHTAPQAVAAGADMLALACPMGEAGNHLIGVDLSGRRQWGLANRAAFGGGRIALATDGKTLWIANGDGRDGKFTVWRCELATGKYSPWNRKDSDGKEVLDLEITPKDGLKNCRAIALRDGKLAVVVAGERRLLVLDAETGDTLKDFKDMPADMAACAFAPDGPLYLAAGKTLYHVDLATGKPSALSEGLDAPQGLAVGKDGKLYVSQRGAKMDVEIFDAQGTRLGAIGKPGGRPATGLFDAAGMLNPAQLALDAKDRLWVAEENLQPKRTSVWNLDGSLAFDLVGSTAYCAGGSVNPFDHTRGFCEKVEYKLDFAKGKFRPLSTLPDALGTGSEYIAKYCRVGGREYVQFRGTARNAGMVKIYLRLPDGSWRHVAEWGNVGDSRAPEDYNQKFKSPLWDGLFGKAFLWVDLNDDGEAQRDEIQTKDVRLGRYYWGQTMGDDLTVVVPTADECLLFKPQGFTAGGAPKYSFAATSSVKPRGGMNGEGMLAMGDGRLFLNQTPLQAVGPDGKILWTYPSKYVSVHGSHNAPAAMPGLLIGPSSFYGTAPTPAGEVFYLNGNLGQNFIFTADGLWVQSLFNDCRGWYDVPAKAVPGMPCDAMTAGGESFGGFFCKSDDGKFYTVGGATAAIVMEVSGLESLKRFGLTATVTPADLAAAQALKVKRAAKTATKKSYTVNGQDLEIQGVAKVKASYDDKNLYLSYQVKDGSPLKNAGQDERLMFIAGDCVDLMLRSDPTAKGAACVKGDLRLLMTVKGGKPLAVLYEPAAPGAAKGEGAVFSSPWRDIPMDRVRVVEFPLEFKAVPGGYTVDASVPLALLGLDSPKGKTFRGDFGVLGSDSAGQECSSRNYWSNKSANNTNDVPDEAILTPSLWGELRFE